MLSIDVVGSTRLQAEQPEAYARINEILLREIAAVTAEFGGAIINFIGDGAVVGFLGPGFNVANDMVFDAATALLVDVYAVMNPALERAGLFAIDVRIGIAVAMAAKVQARGAARELWVGQTLFETLHVSRQNYLVAAPSGEDWEFVGRTGEPYALYRFALPPEDTPEV